MPSATPAPAATDIALAVQRGIILLPLGFATWTLVHASGIHATIAGVLLGFTVPVVSKTWARRGESPEHRDHDSDVSASAPDDRGHGPAAHFAGRWAVPSAVFAVPIFAFFAAAGARALDLNVGVLRGSLLAAATGAVWPAVRNRRHRNLAIRSARVGHDSTFIS